MNIVTVTTEANVIVIGKDGRRFYVVPNNRGEGVKVYQTFGHLGSVQFHFPDNSGDGIACEFLGGNPCTTIDRTVSPMTDETEIFEYLRS